MDVGGWLRDLGLEVYAPAFAANHIDEETLATLGDADLRELGVASLGHRKRLLAAIEAVRAAPTAAPASSAERRQVTILFADLCGFTALSRTLDAEELRAVVAAYTSAVDAIVARFGGTVDKHIGDAVMALFGAPVAHGDDPLRAARAALAIHARMHEVGRELGRELAAHIGIATGEVVAGGLRRGSASDYTVLGDAVNLASRLDGLAGAGETLLSEACYRAVERHTDCEAAGVHAVKGLAEPQRVYRLRGLVATTAARTAFVGRRAELARLTSLLRAPQGVIAVLRGEPGIGKTRLLEEAARLAEEAGRAVHRGRVLDFGVGRGEGSVATVLRGVLGLGPDTPQEAIGDALARAVEGGLVAAEQRPFLEDLLELTLATGARALLDATDPALRLQRKRACAASLLGAACRRQPRLVAVEDVHWADGETLATLLGMARAVVEAGSAFLVTTRPGPTAFADTPAGGAAPAQVLDLAPLEADAAGELARALAPHGTVPAECLERAAGNPLFLEELLRASAAARPASSLPPTIHSLVLARVDRLPARDKAAAQAASVVGQRFDLALLGHLLGDDGYQPAELLQQGVARPAEGAGLFTFAHALIQEGVYASLLRAERAELHRRVAAYYADRDPALAAQHLDRADHPSAPRAYLRAAEAERSAYRGARARALCERGTALATERGDRLELTLCAGQLALDEGSVDRALEQSERARALAASPADRCRALLVRAAALRTASRTDELLLAAEEAEALALEAGLRHERARACYLRGSAYFVRGRMRECAEQHGAAHELAAGAPELEALARSGLGDAAYALGHFAEAEGHFVRCIELARQHGFGRIEVANRSMVSFARMMLGRPPPPGELEASHAAAQRVGNRRAELIAAHALCMAALDAGSPERARVCAEEAVALSQALGTRLFEAESRHLVALCLARLGRRDEAERASREALELYRGCPPEYWEPVLLGGLAALTADEPERRALHARAEELLAGAVLAHNHVLYRRYAVDDACAHEEWDEVARHAAALERFVAGEPGGLGAFVIERARFLVAGARGGRGAELRARGEELVARARATGQCVAAQAVEAALAEIARTGD
ncbi:MAG: AAA family ATPase [Polyangiaceae bacterium]|nr:AAA family ATPase [Polyangiaceae bacterium]